MEVYKRLVVSYPLLVTLFYTLSFSPVGPSNSTQQEDCPDDPPDLVIGGEHVNLATASNPVQLKNLKESSLPSFPNLTAPTLFSIKPSRHRHRQRWRNSRKARWSFREYENVSRIEWWNCKDFVFGFSQPSQFPCWTDTFLFTSGNVFTILCFFGSAK